jgi:glycosyltransferase involved in cell wall biosynthesis
MGDRGTGAIAQSEITQSQSLNRKSPNAIAQSPIAKSPDGALKLSELLSIIVPVYNEEATVGLVIERLLAIEFPVAREILVVNDGSTDGTRRVLDALPLRGENLRIVHAEVNGGKGRAIRTGFEQARGTIVAIQDADLELDPAELATLVRPILSRDAVVVYGSRFLRGSAGAPWLTTAANRFLTGLTNVLYGSRLTDMETCYKLMRTEIARALALEANRFDIEPEITAKLLRAGHRIRELPVRFEPRSRAQGKKIGWRDGVKAIAVLAKHRLR